MRQRLFGSALAAAGVMLMGYVLVQLAVAGEDAQDDVEIDPSTPLFSTHRDRLSICVDGLGGYSVESGDVDRVRNALETGLGRYDNLPPELTSRTVSAGCPPSRVPLGQLTGTGSEYATIVDTPSDHFVFVYLVPPDAYTETFGTQAGYALGSSEKVCSGDVCLSATFALFAPADAGSAVLEQSFLEALRLVPAVPNPEPTLDWSACDVGQQPHPDYSCDQYEEWKRDQEK